MGDAVTGSQKATSSTSPAMASLRGNYLRRINRGRLRVCMHDRSHVPRTFLLCQPLSFLWYVDSRCSHKDIVTKTKSVFVENTHLLHYSRDCACVVRCRS